MKTSSKRIFLLILPILLIIFILLFFIENNVKSYDIQDNSDVYDFVSVNGTEFQSENLNLGNKIAFVYSTLSEKTALNNKDEYIITIGKVNGINNNRYEMFSFVPQEDNIILSSEYINIFDYPQFEMKNGSSYCGSIYVGTVPIDCKSVEIQGTKATLVEQSFDLNGKIANFYLYYCAIEENAYPTSVSVVCESKDGSTFEITTESY